MNKIEPMYCKECGHLGMPVSATPGSFIIEFGLWLCFFLPGLIYSVWRLSARGPVCPKCHIKDAMVPADSPIASRFMTDDQKRDLDESDNLLARRNSNKKPKKEFLDAVADKVL